METGLKINFNCTRPELEGFQEYFNKKMYPTLVEMEEQREKAINKVIRNAIFALGLFIIAAITYYVLDLTFHEENITILIIVVCVYGLLAHIYATKPLREVEVEAKSFLMNKVCSYLKVSYSRKATNFPFSLFKDAGLLPGHDREKLNDHIYGIYNGIAFNLAECSLEKTTRVKSGGKTERMTEEVYHGILASLKYPLPFKGRTLISSDSGMFRNFFKGIIHGSKIELGNSHLDNKYMIHTTDEEEAREILSPQRVEKIMALVDHVGPKALELAFSEEQLLLSIKIDHCHVVSQPVHNAGAFTTAVSYYIEEVCLVFDLIDILELESKTT